MTTSTSSGWKFETKKGTVLEPITTKTWLPSAERTVLDAGVAVRRAIAIPRGGIAATEGICDRALKRIEASLAGTAESHRHDSEAVSHPI